MDQGVYFDGDPATDSARRHMERVLKGQPAARKWPWALAALGSGGVWLLWRLGQAAARARDIPPGSGTPGPEASGSER